MGIRTEVKCFTDRIECLEKALEKIIEMNRQNAQDQYGDADKAETWSCVTVAREALKPTEITING